MGRDLTPEQMSGAWRESLDLLTLALTESDFTFDGEFFTVARPTTIPTRPLQQDLPIWLGALSLGTVAEAARRGWNLMRNLGSNGDHRAAVDHYVQVGREHGRQLGGENVMIERFVALGHSSEEADRNMDRLSEQFGQFLRLYLGDGGRPLPEKDGEFATAGPDDRRPAIAVGGTPDELISILQATLDETGARRLLVEIFSSQERRMFMEEVAPALMINDRVKQPDPAPSPS